MALEFMDTNATALFWILATLYAIEQCWLLVVGDPKHWAIRWSRFFAIGAIVFKLLGYVTYEYAMTVVSALALGSGQICLAAGSVIGLCELAAKAKKGPKE